MSWLSWPWRLLVFSLWFAKELTTTSWAVLKDVLTPGIDARPGIVRYETRCVTDAEITYLAALITLTPGTLALGTSAEGTGADGASGEGTSGDGPRVLYVHAMYNEDAQDARADLAELERQMLHAKRREGFEA